MKKSEIYQRIGAISFQISNLTPADFANYDDYIDAILKLTDQHTKLLQNLFNKDVEEREQRELCNGCIYSKQCPMFSVTGQTLCPRSRKIDQGRGKTFYWLSVDNGSGKYPLFISKNKAGRSKIDWLVHLN